MTQTATPTSADDAPVAGRVGAVGAVGAAGVVGAAGALLVLVAVVLLLAGWHVTQGTSGVGLGDLLGLLAGDDSSDATPVGTRDILLGSRVPRAAAGIAVGFALGVAGALLQSLARNAMASPDTLGVTGGAYFAVTVVAAFGISLPLWASGITAFAGGIAAAAVVLALSGGAGTSTTRLILAGSAVALALQAGTSTLLILFREETTSLFAWGNGSLNQLGLDAFWQAAPIVVVCTAAGLLMSRRLDLLGLGDDTAGVLGVPVRSTRVTGTVLAVLLIAAAVTVAGPIGFVGLCAPVIARLLGRLVPAVHRHLVLLPAAGLIGAVVVIGADAALRAAIGADEAISIPTGVTTTLLGAVVLVLLARRGRDAGPTRQPPGTGMPARGRARFVLVLIVCLLVAIAAGVVGMMAGDSWLRAGDLSLYLAGDAPVWLQFVLDERAPRVAAALLAGAGLALSGTLVQATCRNPLAEPGILGITGGAGVGAVLVVTRGATEVPSPTAVLVAAVVGALVAFALVYGLAWRNGLDADRLVLIGIGFWYGAMALVTYLLVRSNPWDTPRIYTWMSGTTYGRTWEQVTPVAIAVAVAIPLTWVVRRELDLLALDEDTPRLVGVGLEKVRLLVLLVAAVLAALCVSAVGVVGFVGLVAPHAARALVGGRHVRVIPVAVLLGAALLGVADLVGRTAIAPAQVPAGLVVALIGAPYFVFLLARSRA